MSATSPQPLVSIVVLTRNNPQELDDTLASIRSQQTAAVLQVVVVDGSDEPVSPQTVAPFELVRDHPARGIYPAMNLGLARSRGHWVQFLNSGDSWLHPHALQRLLDHAQMHENRKGRLPRVVFGQAQICPAPPSRCAPWLFPDPAVCSLGRWMWWYQPNHQAMLVEGNWARDHPFRLDAPHGADSAWKAQALHDLAQVAYLREPVVAYNLGGVSSQLPTWAVLCMRLGEPTRSLTGKAAQIIKFGLRPFARHYPRLMALRSRLVGWLV
jgi:glycosyltransferase involved in cell wall biosynthesis